MATSAVATAAADSHKMKVLICIDESQWAAAAFEFYCNSLHKDGHEVVCFHCIHPPFYPGDASNVNPHVYQLAAKEAITKAEELEKKYAQKMKEKKMPGTITARLTNEPGYEIVKKAEADKIDLIIIGTRGLGTLKRTLLGSVSHYVLHHAHCPVLVCNHKHE
ncbi:hypothetical protein HELRODRAFT_192415 [Helobdella robusta]|uniref:UspA domain-containing protein n=1 Tax=Helobdella robusta TaxID=6412 RepID=T1FTX9_HELRO|nr:hypothetical protein HELRODRAFT_192415 [Helobdella robusta]ESO00785.1 hypothetical protein HELRODRAFT_192415 [Helobdella robusta]